MRAARRRVAAVTATSLLVLGATAGGTAVAKTAPTSPRPVPATGPLSIQASSLPAPSDPCDTDAALRYVAGGDAVLHWTGNSDDPGADDRYPEQLLTEHLQTAPGPWCLWNTSADPTTTDEYMDGGPPSQQALANDLRPRLITLTIGRQNDSIVEHVTTCLQNIKDHDFLEANTCALQVLTDQGAWDELSKDLADILNRYKVQMAGNPQLVVAVTGYFNPYPRATSVATKIPQFCANLQDTIPTCTIRWILLPPALISLDQVVRKLNTTIETVVAPFTQSSQGRFVFVNPYEKFADHCTKMDVEIKTTVYHPPNTVHKHDSSKDFGCDDPWIATDGNDGTKTPFPYLTPAVGGVLTLATQTTKGMGIYPDTDGHDCIADLIWEATKNKLGVPEAPKDACT
jgi:hypothetical protein